MSLISYAQNFEDIMLWRALKEVKSGFYIDIGAHSDREGSVTKLFYDKSWHGINIEPIKEVYENLNIKRLRDINLNICIGAYNGSLELYDIRPTGLATANIEIANSYKEKGYTYKVNTVPVKTLSSIWEEYVDTEVHFLKIDVEGFEKEVLEGTNLRSCRPWIIVIEATHPNSPISVHKQWEEQLLDSDYIFVYFDGLNRFYIAKEHEYLEKYFKVPPNFFDNFALDSTCFLAREIIKKSDIKVTFAEEKANSWWKKADSAEVRAIEAEEKANIWWKKAGNAEARVIEAEEKANSWWKKAGNAEKRVIEAEEKANSWWEKAGNAEKRVIEAEEKANQAEVKMIDILLKYKLIVNSNSWKLTKPYRYIADKIKWFYANAINWLFLRSGSRPRRIVKKIILSLKKYLHTYPKVKEKVLSFLDFFPKIKEKLRQVGKKDVFIVSLSHDSEKDRVLSLEVQKVYLDLKKSIEIEEKN
jgi:FkbM family methyltransferase